MSVENLHNERKLSFSGVKSTVMNFVNQHLFRFEKRSIDQQMQEPVNNYFKTTEEMEADFSVETYNEIGSGEKTAEEIYFLAMTHTEIRDGYLNIPDPVNIKSGFMEENY